MRQLLRFLFVSLLLLGALVGLARFTALRWWRVPADDPFLEASLAPTLRGGDWIILWRLTPPRFGDLVLCPEPNAPDRIVIGRIAGVAGEKVLVKGSNLFVNGRRARTEGRCFEEAFTTLDPQTGAEVEQRCDREELGSRVHQRGSAPEKQRPADVNARVGEGEVFLVSDNRLFPYDSRDFGPVERESCTETVVFRLVGAGGFGDVQSRLTFVH